MHVLGSGSRRFGTVLLAFGLVGLVLGGLVAGALVAGAVTVRSLGDELEADRLAVVDSLGKLSTSVGGAALAAANMRATLGSTGTVITNVDTTLGDVADSIDTLAGGLDFQILGQRPLAGAAESFAGLADEVRSFGDDLDKVATDLQSNQQDLDDMAASMRDLQRRIDALTTRVKDFDRVDELVTIAALGMVLAAALAAWIAAAGLLAAWIGRRLRRQSSG